MNELNYAPVRRRTRGQITQALSTDSPEAIHDALISAAYWDEDWRWAQHLLVRFAEYDNEKVLWAVALGLGYIAVFHGEIDEEIVCPILAHIKGTRPALASVVQETEEEIEHFVKLRRKDKKISLGRRLPEDWRPPSQRQVKFH
ncbi:MAG TPA: hypothetical protein VKZ53_19205 [Candidatus Angelobacter sp.]|nr:hypothetical protein [Candidatus Angelobacter sp.]